MKEGLRGTDSAEITEWAAYERVYGPLGGLRGDYQAAVIAAAISNGFRGLAGKRGSRKIDGFMLKWDTRKSRVELTPEQMLARVRSLNRQLGGKEVGLERFG